MSSIPTSNTADLRTWLEPKQVAAILRKSRQTVIHMIDDGRLRGAIVGGGSKRRRLKVDPTSVPRGAS
jgi:hypothetical protein